MLTKTHIKSWFEVWNSKYINCNCYAMKGDKALVILQIECGTDGNYIVEVVKPEDYKQPLFSMKGD